MEITEKQRSYVAFIQEETGIVFNGTTKQEASKYISENKNKVPASASINMWALVKGY
jgi:predicted RNase H-like HicB family nuclease